MFKLGFGKRANPVELNDDTTQSRASWQLIIQVSESRQRVVVPLQEQLTVGRAQTETIYQHMLVDIDLEPVGAADCGVSRLHAYIYYHDGKLFVEDAGSTNGTRLNGLRLHPNKVYRLRHSDELELGRMRLTLRPLHAPNTLR